MTQEDKRVSGIRILAIHTPSPEDIERAKQIDRRECPRRYCWWWRSLAFDWDLSVEEGCRFLKAQKPPGWIHEDLPCRRCDPASIADHYEPREPHLLEDGFEETDWVV
jgi:hypothetical protein